MLRRLLKVIAWSAVAVVLLVFLALVGVRLYFSDARLAKLIPELLSEELAGDFSIEELNWDFPRTVELAGVSVKDPEGVEVITAKKVRASAALLPLLKLEIRIAGVTASDVEVKLFPPPEGHPERGPFTLADAFMPAQPAQDAPDPTAKSPTISIEAEAIDRLTLSVREGRYGAAGKNIAIRNGFFLFGPDDLEAAATVRIEEVKLRKRKPGPDEVEEFGPIHIALDAAKFEQDRASGKSKVHVDSASISGLSSKIDLTGNLQGIPDDLEGDAKGTITLALDDPQLRALLPEAWLKELDPKGTAAITFDAQGSPASGGGTLELRGTELMIAGAPVEGLRLKARFAEQLAKIEELDLRLGGEATLRAFGTLGVAEPFGHELDIRATNIPVRAIAGRWADPAVLPRSVTATIAATGRSLSPLDTQVSAEARVQNIPGALTQGLFTSGTVRATGHVYEDRASISQLFASSDGVSVRGSGEVPFAADRPIALTIEARDEKPSAHFAKLNIPVTAKSVALSAKAKGTFTHPAVTGVLTASEVRTEQTPAADVRAPVSMTDGVVRVEKGEVSIDHGRLEVDGSARVLDARGAPIASPVIDAVARLYAVEVAPFSEDRVEGSISGVARFQGTATDYQASASLDPAILSVAGTTIAVSRIELAGDEHELVLQPLRINPEEGGVLIAQGTLHTQAQTFVADVRGRELPVLLAGAFLEEAGAWGGTVELGAHAEGALTRPVVTATAAIADLSIENIDLDRVTADLSTDLEEVRAKIAVRSAAGDLDVDGKLAIETQVIEARVQGIDLDVRKLPVVPARELGLDGKLGIDIYASGTLPVPNLAGTIAVRELMLDEQKLGNGRLEAKIKTDDRGRWVLSLAALGSVRGSATLARVENPTEGRIPLFGDAVVELDGLQLADVIPSLAANGVQVVTAGRAELAIGKSKVPVTGKLSLSKLDAKFGQETLGAQSPIVVEWDGENFELQPMTLAGTTGEFRARGRYGEVLDFHADGTIQLAFVEPFVAEISRAEGRVQLSAEIRGTPDTPLIEGQVTLLTAATIKPRMMIREMVLEAGRISLRPGSLRIDQLEGRISGGEFTASGDLALDGFKPARWNLRFDGSNLPIRTNELLIEADANVRATGTGLVPKISGDVDIIRGRYLRKFRLEQFVFVQKGSSEEDADLEEVEPNPYLEELELDIHARSAGAIKLKIDAQAFAMEMDLGADVFVRGTAASPLLDGRVTAESGWLKFPAAKLDVEQLVVDFNPTLEESIHPEINLVATGEVTAAPSGGESRPTPYEVSVRIEGPLDAMRLEMTSDPDLPQEEVLSLVVLGQADPTTLVQTSETKGSGAIESSLVFASSQLATPVTRFVEKQLEKQLNLELQLGTEVSAERFRLTAAKELTSRFRIEGGYERLFTESAYLMTGRALLFISDDFFLEGSAQNVTASNSTTELETGTSGQVELKLRFLGE